MELRVILLYYMSSFAGLVMVVGGIWLLYKEKIYIDSESKQVTEIEIPMVGKFKTNLPALVLFGLGFVPLIYPMAKCSVVVPELVLKGSVKGDAFPVQVYAVVRTESVAEPRDFSLHVPALADYKLLYVGPGMPPYDAQLELKAAREGELQYRPVELQASRKEIYHPNELQPKPAEFR